MNEQQQFYGDALPELQAIETQILNCVAALQRQQEGLRDRNPIEHYKSRIKSIPSMREKLRRKQLPETLEAALHLNHDTVGARVVCTFISDVYQVADSLRASFHVTEEKDFIRQPKENGYRSYHLILHFPAGEDGRRHEVFGEIQIRTIAMDCWASLEHQLKYKKKVPNQALIVRELKRCADEIASTDLTMQTIRELLDAPEPEEAS